MPTRLSALLATSICVFALAACGSDDKKASTSTAKTTPAAPAQNLDTTSIAKSIESTILSERKIKAKVTCPDLVAKKKGVKFVCNAVVKGQGSTPFDVTETDDNGATTFAARG